MDSNLIKLIAALLWAVIVGLLANRKNRNPIGWGIVGALSWLIALVVLAFMPYLCPKCKQKISNKDAKAGVCQNCVNVEQNEVIS
tara:strand:+ start:732 stop:986 length:255 start_codon:yes stop_codon:yes gene_type:complete